MSLLRLLPPADAPAARQAAREDFVARFTAAMGHEPAADDLDRWYRR